MKGIGTTAVHQAYRVGLLERGIAPVMAVFVLHFASTTAAQAAAVQRPATRTFSCVVV